jgi:hypothetical protein
MPTPALTHGQAVRDLCAMLQRTFDMASPVELFRGFVHACHLMLDDLPAHLHYTLTGQSIAAPDSLSKWERAMGRFSPKTLETFAHGFATLLMASHFLPPGQSYDTVGGPDIIGSIYMDLLSGVSRKWDYKAQFFTPWNVAFCIAEMTRDDDLEACFHREVKTLLQSHPALQAITLAASMMGQDTVASEDAFFWWLKRAWPFIQPKLTPIRINDPCVGSGRMLLASVACHPLWLSQIGYLQYSGMDLDQLCVDMARLNLRLYGLTPMRIEPATLAALESRLEERAGPWAPAYQAVLEASPAQRPAVEAEVVKTINRARIVQLSLFNEGE